jgi:hypothetical protein
MDARGLEALLDPIFAGKYRPNIYCHACESGAYVPDPVEVKVNEDGTLSFRESSDGKITYMFQETYRTYERVSR